MHFLKAHCLRYSIACNSFSKFNDASVMSEDIPYMPITELENGSESVWVKVFANKTSHFVASWYRPPDGKIEELELFKNQLEKVKTLHKGNNPPPPPIGPCLG